MAEKEFQILMQEAYKTLDYIINPILRENPDIQKDEIIFLLESRYAVEDIEPMIKDWRKIKETKSIGFVNFATTT